jgi:hypothetical protein
MRRTSEDKISRKDAKVKAKKGNSRKDRKERKKKTKESTADGRGFRQIWFSAPATVPAHASHFSANGVFHPRS